MSARYEENRHTLNRFIISMYRLGFWELAFELDSTAPYICKYAYFGDI